MSNYAIAETNLILKHRPSTFALMYNIIQIASKFSYISYLFFTSLLVLIYLTMIRTLEPGFSKGPRAKDLFLVFTRLLGRKRRNQTFF